MLKEIQWVLHSDGDSILNGCEIHV